MRKPEILTIAIIIAISSLLFSAKNTAIERKELPELGEIKTKLVALTDWPKRKHSRRELGIKTAYANFLQGEKETCCWIDKNLIKYLKREEKVLEIERHQWTGDRWNKLESWYRGAVHAREKGRIQGY